MNIEDVAEQFTEQIEAIGQQLAEIQNRLLEMHILFEKIAVSLGVSPHG